MLRLRSFARVPLVLLILLAVLLAGAPPAARAQPSARVAYLIDFASSTLDEVDLVSGVVSLGILPVGDVPNDIRVRGRTAYIVNSAPENLQIVDLAVPATVATVGLGPGTNPWGLALGEGTAYISLWGTDAVAVVDLAGPSLSTTIPVGVSPEGLCLAGSELYVANSGFVEFGVYEPGTVSVIDTATGSLVATIPVGLNPQWCAVDGEGEVHVVCSDQFGANSGRVFVIDPVAHAVVESLWVGGFPGPIEISAGGIGWMVEYGAGLLAIDTVHNLVLHDVNDPVSAGGLGALGLGLDRAGRVHVAVSADRLLTVVGADGALEAVYAVGPGPADVAVFEDEPVPVRVADAAGRRRGGGVELDWRLTGGEIAGCHVERAPAAAGGAAFRRLTAVPLRSERDRFTYFDSGADPGPIRYRIVGVTRGGVEEALAQLEVSSAAAPIAAAVAARPNPAPGPVAVEVSGLAGPLEVVVFDAAGRAVRLLHRGVAAAAGPVRLEWDGRDEAGLAAPGGVYVVRAIGPAGVRRAKVALLR